MSKVSIIVPVYNVYEDISLDREDVSLEDEVDEEIIEENLSNINLYSTNSKNKEFSDLLTNLYLNFVPGAACNVAKHAFKLVNVLTSCIILE